MTGDWNRAEWDEIHNSTRNIFQLILSWYAFFVTANLAGAGYLLSLDLQKLGMSLWMVRIPCMLFLVLDAMACIWANTTIIYFRESKQRTDHIADRVNTKEYAELLVPIESPLPYRVYEKSIKTIFATIPVMSIGWAVIFALTFHD